LGNLANERRTLNRTLSHATAEIGGFLRKKPFGTADANLRASVSTRFRRRKMFNITLPQTITAAIGAIVLSTMFVGSAVGPVHASQIAQVQTSAQANA